MPTFFKSSTFKADYKRLSATEKTLVLTALAGFVEDLTEIEAGRQTSFRPGLRVKPMKGAPGIWELTWEINNGRSTFQYGSEQREGKRHVEWRRIGGHDIFANP